MRKNRFSLILASLLSLALALFAAHTAVSAESFSPVNVVSMQWGFNGKVISGAFNQFCVLIANDSEKPFDGVVSLLQPSFSASVGTEYAQEVYLAAHSRKWVVFAPFIKGSGRGEWRLKWGQGKDCQQNLVSPDEGLPGIVFISPPANLMARPGVHLFPDTLFPSSVLLTAGLDAALIAEPPAFSPSQADAFMDWLSMGGQLYVLPGPGGAYPDFSGKLSLLNRTDRSFAIGKGKVIRLKAAAREVNLEFLAKSGYEVPALEKNDNNTYYYWNHGEDILRYLKDQIKTTHNWTLIYSSAAVYLLLISVLNLFIGRKTRDYRKPLLFFFCTVIFFSLLFAHLGARGYGEKSVINDLTYARSLGSESFAVSQWLNVFATTGARYRLAHGEELRYYVGADEDGRGHDVACNGSNGFFTTEIPRYSSINLLHGGKFSLPGSGLSVTKTSIERDGKLLEFEFKLDETFANVETSVAWAVCGGEIIDMAWNGRRCFLSGSRTSMDKYSLDCRSRRYYRGSGEEDDLVRIKESLVPPLILASRAERSPWTWSPDKKMKKRNRSGSLDFYFIAQTPAAFQPAADDFSVKHGYTLFHYSVPLTTTEGEP